MKKEITINEICHKVNNNLKRVFIVNLSQLNRFAQGKTYLSPIKYYQINDISKFESNQKDMYAYKRLSGGDPPIYLHKLIIAKSYAYYVRINTTKDEGGDGYTFSFKDECNDEYLITINPSLIKKHILKTFQKVLTEKYEYARVFQHHILSYQEAFKEYKTLLLRLKRLYNDPMTSIKLKNEKFMP